MKYPQSIEAKAILKKALALKKTKVDLIYLFYFDRLTDTNWLEETSKFYQSSLMVIMLLPGLVTGIFIAEGERCPKPVPETWVRDPVVLIWQ